MTILSRIRLLCTALALAGGLSALMSAEVARAQQPTTVQLPKEALTRLDALPPPTLSAAVRLSLASRVVGRPVALTALTSTAVVTPNAPVSPQMTMSAYGVSMWQVDTGAAGGFIMLNHSPAAADMRTRSRVVIRFNAVAGQRYLMICNMNRGASWNILRGTERASMTWEGDFSGALLIPPRATAGDVTIMMAVDSPPPDAHHSLAGTVSRCEISAITV